MVRVAVLHGHGLNCWEETSAAWRACGAAAEVVLAGDWLAGADRLDRFDLVHFSGGFSFGDHLGAGQAFANALCVPRSDRTTPRADLLRLVARGGHLVGVCNGFQILARAGLVPNLAGTGDVEVALAANRGGTFVDRWVGCVTDGQAKGWLDRRAIALPIRHGQGRVVVATPAVAAQIEARGLAVLRYARGERPAGGRRPANPNGSAADIAALLSADGRVLGLMPHPEAFTTPFHHPDWPLWARRGQLDRLAIDGLDLLRALVRRAEATR